MLIEVINQLSERTGAPLCSCTAFRASEATPRGALSAALAQQPGQKISGTYNNNTPSEPYIHQKISGCRIIYQGKMIIYPLIFWKKTPWLSNHISYTIIHQKISGKEGFLQTYWENGNDIGD